MSFQSCLETNSFGIGMARGTTRPICNNLGPNLDHSIEVDNSNIALEPFNFCFIPPMTITPLPVGDVTIACSSNRNGKFGPEI